MSSLETEIKPLLTKLVLSETCMLEAKDLKKLGRWIAKTAVTIEALVNTQPHNRVGRYIDRSRIRRFDSVPQTFSIFIGSTTKTAQEVGCDYANMYVNSFPYGTNIYEAPNVQSLLFGVGCLICFVFISNTADFRVTVNEGYGMVRIWPITQPEIIWPQTDMSIEDMRMWGNSLRVRLRQLPTVNARMFRLSE